MKIWAKTSIIFFIAYMVLVYSPSIIDFKPTAYNLPLPDFHGPLAENSLLSAAEHLFAGLINGPESLVFYKGDLYTGVADGRIVKIKDGKIETVAHTGRRCEYIYEERQCGRPLGLRIGSDGLLYIIDAYYGVFTMNFTTGTLNLVLSSEVRIEGRKLNFPDDLDIDDDGNIYFTDASQKWDLSTILYLMLENENGGRVIRYNMRSKETEVLASNLNFPNGVQLSKDKKSLLVCDLMKRRILKYNLKGEKKGQLEVFADNLPAEPDNIRRSPRGYWVAFTSARNNTNPLLLDHINSYPSVKVFGARVHHVLSTTFLKISEMLSQPTLKELAYKFKRGDYYLNLVPRHGFIAEFDENGQILRSLHSPDGKTSDLSEVQEYDGHLYLGSFVNNYLGRLKL